MKPDIPVSVGLLVIREGKQPLQKQMCMSLAFSLLLLLVLPPPLSLSLSPPPPTPSLYSMYVVYTLLK